MKKKVLIAAAILGVLCLVAIFLRPREKPFDDSDLKVVRSQIAPEENAFTLIEQASEALVLSEQDVAQFKDNLDPDGEWNAEWVSRVLADNRDALNLFYQSWKRERIQVPEMADFLAEKPYLKDIKRLANLVELEAMDFLKTGRPNESLRLGLELVRFGHRFEGAEVTIMDYLAGIGIKQRGLKMMQLSVGHKLTSSDLLVLSAEQLSHFTAHLVGISNALKLEHSILITTLSNFVQPSIFDGNRLLWNEDKTRLRSADFTRTLLGAIPLCYNQMPTDLAPESKTGFIKYILSGNLMGDAFFEIMAIGKDHVLSRKCRENVEVGATRVLLALRLWQREHGSLPESLDALVPRYLSEIPKDDFDGQPLRYSREKKLIWSVGSDLKDSGGQERNAKNEILDFVYPVDF